MDLNVLVNICLLWYSCNMKENGTGIIGYTQLLLLNEVLFLETKYTIKSIQQKKGKKFGHPIILGDWFSKIQTYEILFFLGFGILENQMHQKLLLMITLIN